MRQKKRIVHSLVVDSIIMPKDGLEIDETQPLSLTPVCEQLSRLLGHFFNGDRFEKLSHNLRCIVAVASVHM